MKMNASMTRYQGVIRSIGQRKGLRSFPLIKASKPIYFFYVGLNESLYLQVTWHRVECWIKARESARIDLVDFGPPDRDQTHVLKSKQSIALVKSNGRDLMLRLADHGMTGGYLWTHRWRLNGGNQGIVKPSSWDRGLLIVRYTASSEPSKLFKWNGWLGFKSGNCLYK